MTKRCIDFRFLKKVSPCYVPKKRHYLRGLRLVVKWFDLVVSTLLLIVAFHVFVSPNKHVQASTPPILMHAQSSDPQQLVQQGRNYYREGQWQVALSVWQQAEAAFATHGDFLSQAMVLSNMALAHHQLNQSIEAQQANDASLSLLQAEVTNMPGYPRVLAQAFNTQATLQLAQGQAQQALTIWEKATTLYQQIGEEAGVIQSLINQAQSLRTLGFYRRAQVTLEQVEAQLAMQPESLMKAVGLYNLGNTYRLLGQLDTAQASLERSLAIFEALESSRDINAALFSLGNTARSRQTPSGRQAALNFYQQAADTADSPVEWMQAQANRLSLLVDTRQIRGARALWPEMLAYIENHTTSLSNSHAGLYVQINVAQSLIQLRQQAAEGVPDLMKIAQLFADVGRQAEELRDVRAKSYAIGYLGQLYEQHQQWTEAKPLTEEALDLALQANAPEIIYRWQWQLGRLLNAQGNPQQAIAAYTEAVNALNTIRQDLAVINRDLQFSFQDSVEPVYRELVTLLLHQSSRETSVSDETRLTFLEQARNVIESLQVAELDDFFQQACLEVQPVVADQVDAQTAVVYSILLGDRLEVILSLPNQPLRRYGMDVPEREFKIVLNRLQDALHDDYLNGGELRADIILPLGQQLYDWLIRPAESYLATSHIKTLAFVLDGPLRNIPMAVLHDGQHYLIETYSVALSPGLQLINPQSLPRAEIRALAMGLSKQVDVDFPALDNVLTELDEIQSVIPNTIRLLDERFTKTMIQSVLDQTYFPIVHMATHGQFSSNAEDTFILTWPDSNNPEDDGRVNVNELQALLQSRDLTGQEAIELLVLSACQTADGDDRAALGLAGVAFRAGARSTVATLWPVSDEATSVFMSQFYQALADTHITRAEALRRAQISLLQSDDFSHPFFWAPYTLIGNWL